MKDCCATCRYWASEDNKQGLCRRYPATPIMIGMAAPAIVADPRGAQPQPVIMSYYPNMFAHGWCGEFKGRFAS